MTRARRRQGEPPRLRLGAGLAICAMGLGLGCDRGTEARDGSALEPLPGAVRSEAPSSPRRDGGASRGPSPPAGDAGPAGGSGRPLEALDDEALEARLLEAPETLGPASIGTPGLGGLMNAVQMPYSDRWQIVEPHQAWGTQETIDSIIRAIDAVHERHGSAPPLYIGDISRKHGGYIHPHQFHQNGRDVDLGFYYSSPKRWYWKAWRSNLDVPRTWSLIKALITETDVELIFCDRYVIRLLQEHAKEIGEDRRWLVQVFGWHEETKTRPLVRHEPGHRTHIHVRFYTPVAQQAGRRLYPLLKKHRMLRHPELLVEHTVAEGETIAKVAKAYKTSRRAIRRVNDLEKEAELTPGRTYLVPKRVKLEQDDSPLVVPPRTLPPPPDEAAGSG